MRTLAHTHHQPYYGTSEYEGDVLHPRDQLWQLPPLIQYLAGILVCIVSQGTLCVGITFVWE